MSNSKIATRYASALMALTAENKKPVTIAKELLTVKTAIENSRELQLVLASPVISKEKKQSIIAEIFKKKIGIATRTYLASIIEKGREMVLAEILKRYFELRDDELGIVRVHVTTSIDFSLKQEKDLQKQLEVMTKKKVDATFSIDRLLKGGFVARVGDTVLDGSVKRQLEILKTKLKDGSFSN